MTAFSWYRSGMTPRTTVKSSFQSLRSHVFFSVLSVFVLAGCLEQDGGSSLPEPELFFQCSEQKSNACSATQNGAVAFVGLSRDVFLDCEVYFSQLNGDPLYSHFAFSGQTEVVWNGSALEGNNKLWVDSNNVLVRDFAGASYAACVFIDLNEDGALSPGEPVGQGKFNPDFDNTTVNDFQTH